ncbi:hypothetical protein [Agrobacterium tumefaciens]|uniref:hypothetical protein n=1 Tax=Agrobacterium tumefaciens TaxID=358 RepID=UPI001571C2CD|nr:hypothetical protein [Agrobacterium tumefaciens]NTB05790.1 hypothetical protein [Agrobacterium tumefaciens]
MNAPTMQIIDSSIQNTKENLELYMLQLRKNSEALLREMKMLNTAVEQELEFIQNLIANIK